MPFVQPARRSGNTTQRSALLNLTYLCRLSSLTSAAVRVELARVTMADTALSILLAEITAAAREGAGAPDAAAAASNAAPASASNSGSGAAGSNAAAGAKLNVASLMASLRRNERSIEAAGPAAAAVIRASLLPQNTAANVFLLYVRPAPARCRLPHAPPMRLALEQAPASVVLVECSCVHSSRVGVGMVDFPDPPRASNCSVRTQFCSL